LQVLLAHHCCYCRWLYRIYDWTASETWNGNKMDFNPSSKLGSEKKKEGGDPAHWIRTWKTIK
jgi:hypothetical protein